jgi:hypothetical protein
MSSQSHLQPNLSSVKTSCVERLSPASGCYRWSLFVLDAYVNFEPDEEEAGLFDCFEIEALRQQLIETWLP